MRLLIVLGLAFGVSVASAQCVNGVCKLRPQVTVQAGPVNVSVGTNHHGIKLAPGERLLSVGGKPVGPNVSVQAPGVSVQVGDNVPDGRVIINRDPVAFAHAQAEARMIARMGPTYHRQRGGGHPMGVAPRCRYSGTGYTWDKNRPGHCYENELPTSRIVARARATDGQGRWYWSCHYSK